MSDFTVASNTNESGYIDAHVHLWTSDTQRYPLASGFSSAQMQPANFTAKDLFELTAPLGIKRIVLIQMVFYGFDNSYMLDTIRAFPDTFSGIALVDENGGGWNREMRRLKQYGVTGVRITPPKQGDLTWLDRPSMRILWHCAAEEKLAICPLIDPVDLPALDRACEKFPNTTVVIDHCARLGGDGEIRESDLKGLCNLAKYPRTYVKLSAFYFLGKKEPPYTDLAPMIRRLLDAYGANRLMWASDSPFQIQSLHSYRDSFNLIHDRLDFLSNEDRGWILGRTAEKVFFGQRTTGSQPR